MNFLSDENGADLKQLFFESAQELLHSLNEEGLRLEKNTADEETIRSIRRSVHTLKGDSAACGYHELSELAHAVEDVLTPDVAHNGNRRLAELVLAAADTFALMLAAYRSNAPLPSGEALRALIRKARPAQRATSADNSAAQETAAFRWTEYEQMLLADGVNRGTVLQVQIEVDKSCSTPKAAYELIRKALAQTGEILAIHPEEAFTTPLTHVEAAILTEENVEGVARKCQIPAIVSSVQVLPWAAVAGEARPTLGGNSDQKLSPEAKAETGPAPAASAEGTLRVDAERIDAVLNLVGELIIGKSMLHQTLAEFDRRHSKDPLRGRFADAMAFQSRVLTDLQKSVMKIRMVPVEQLFRRFPRLVRDLAKACGREVQLETSGEDTELDKSILDVLAEPLTHLIRNAVDHGIEPPSDRDAAGKPRHGTLRLNAFHQGNQVVIEISDDGRGIDRSKVIASAVERRLVSSQRAAQLSDAEALELVFHPGLSTAEEVTSISGRGVGMDVVKTIVEGLKGAVQIESRLGEGTTVFLKVPLTLAIIKALLFRVGDKLYAVPLGSVLEITRIEGPEIHRVDQHEVMQLRDEVLTLVRLEKLQANNGSHTPKRLFVVVIHLGGRKFGLIVDKLVGEEELVIKAISDQLIATDLVSGASILGDGSVVLILNLTAVVSRLSAIDAFLAGTGPAVRDKGVLA